jgi:hypothetical protein
MRKITLLLIAIYVSTNLLNAQLAPKKGLMTNMAEEANKTWLIKRAEAESIAVKNNIPIRKEFEDGRIIELQRFDHGIPIYNETDNINAAATVSSNKVWKDNFGGYSLSGKGVTLGEWDGGGIRVTHQEYQGRASQMDMPSSVSDHSTHVGGTMISAGIDPKAKGMSSSAKLNEYDWNNAETEMTNEANKGLKASNHSYGQVVGWTSNYRGDGRWTWFGDTTLSRTEDYNFGLYTDGSAFWDLLAFQHPNYLICKSAGNNRGEGPTGPITHWLFNNGNYVLATAQREVDGGADGYGCLEYRAVCKNVLTVAAIYGMSNGYTQASDVRMSSFSDWGPTDDGRIKPDISADGINLYSLNSTGDNAYVTMSGTSMATPNVTGSVGLILEHQNNLHPDTALYAATVKGLILHTADEAGANPGPDYVFGWGVLNTYKVVQMMSLNAQLPGSPLIKEYTLNQGQTIEYQVTSNGKEPLRATISWEDWPGNPPPRSLNPKDIMLVNDLDLRIIGPGGTYMPWILDPANPSAGATKGDNIRDNVEQVLIDNPAAGTYTIRISHKGNLFQSKQDVSLLVSGIALPKPAAPSLNTPSSGAVDADIDLVFTWNRSDRGVSYQIQVATDNLFNNIIAQDSAIGGVQKSFSALPGLKDLFWRVRASNNGGVSDWSPVWNFKTRINSPLAPVLVYPADGAVNLKLKDVVFKWNAASYANAYNLKINAGIIPFLTASNLTDTAYSVSSQFTDGKKYVWSVNAANNAGTSSYSASYSFTTLMLAPDSLKASVVAPNQISLTWVDKSATETTYVILRKRSVQGEYTQLISLASNATSYVDTALTTGGTYYYKVFCSNSVATSDSGKEVVVTLTDVQKDNSSMPSEFSLMQNYPNPFNPSTVIKYALPVNSQVKLTVYNVLGKEVMELVNNSQTAGFHEVNFDGSSLSSGVYFYQITAKASDGSRNFREVKKLILMK